MGFEKMQKMTEDSEERLMNGDFSDGEDDLQFDESSGSVQPEPRSARKEIAPITVPVTEQPAAVREPDTVPEQKSGRRRSHRTKNETVTNDIPEPEQETPKSVNQIKPVYDIKRDIVGEDLELLEGGEQSEDGVATGPIVAATAEEESETKQQERKERKAMPLAGNAGVGNQCCLLI